jgi:hypothetical protein
MIVIACCKKKEEGKKKQKIEDTRRKSSVNSACMHSHYLDEDSSKAFVPDPDLSYSSIHRINMRKKIQCATNHYN